MTGEAVTAAAQKSILEVEDLAVHIGAKPLVQNISFTLDRGDRLGLIGESGSGKSLTALAIMGLLPDGLNATGRVLFEGRDLLDLNDRAMTAVRGNSISMIFQEPMTALNPVMRIRKQIGETLRIHQGLSKSDANERAVDLLVRVGIDQPERRAMAFPHEMSGGQRQRAMIAMALACGPDLVIADEPTTALDVTVQAQVLSLLRDQVAAYDASLILITHDLPVVASVTSRVVVLRHGQIVEHGETGSVFTKPADAYTQALIDSVPPMSRAIEVPLKPASPKPEGQPIITLREVHKSYRLRRTKLRDAQPFIHAVAGVSLDVFPGDTFGIVGESGSGKSTIAKMMMGLERPTSGQIVVDDIDVATGDLRPLREVAQMVFQDPNGSLDPRMRVGDIIAEPLRSLGIVGDHDRRVSELLDAVSLPADSIRRFAHEFSGGQRQRIAIARALAPGPRVLIADEPVSALDMSVQTVTLELLAELKREFDLTMVFISHDLSVVHEICEHVVVLEHGSIVEQGPVSSVFKNPTQPYTQRLIAAIPRLDGSFAQTP